MCGMSSLLQMIATTDTIAYTTAATAAATTAATSVNATATTAAVNPAVPDLLVKPLLFRLPNNSP